MLRDKRNFFRMNASHKRQNSTIRIIAAQAKLLTKLDEIYEFLAPPAKTFDKSGLQHMNSSAAGEIFAKICGGFWKIEALLYLEVNFQPDL